MPVTIKTAPHEANKFEPRPPAKGVKELFRDDPVAQRAVNFISSSLTPNSDQAVYAQNNGFVQTVIHAYNRHYHSTIRPDDVWISILSQFSSYVNANAEQLRSKFVSHTGKKELQIEIPPTSLENIDFNSLTSRMTNLLNQHLVDKDLKKWILPTFSTTTQVDKTVSAIIMMASMKAYFDYTGYTLCGIPSVTLDGTREDWIDLRTRLGKLAEFGESTRIWGTMIEPVVSKFIAAFDGEVDVEFWGHIASPVHMGSGSPTVGGWITAFCAFNGEGKFTGPVPENFISQEYNWNINYEQQTYSLGGVRYPIIDQSEIPAARCEVDLKIIDFRTDLVFETVMVAGNMAMKVGSDEERGGSRVQNLPTWFVGLMKERNREDKDKILVLA
jgi:hypothetical protein